MIRAWSRARSKGLRIALNLILARRPTEDMIRLGTDYGGWWIPGSAAGPGMLAYCAGAGEDVSFDLALLDRGCTVRTFDPTPRALEHVRSLGITNPRFTFHPIGWWNAQQVLKFFAPADPAHVSHSVVNLQRTSDYFEAPVDSVLNLATQLGDSKVSIMKMDIEGAELHVIPDLLHNGPLPDVLCVEFDQPQSAIGIFRTIRALHAHGYSIRKVERWSFTFSKGISDTSRTDG